jgi:Holliday junction resolvase RusA-like endonuclease
VIEIVVLGPPRGKERVKRRFEGHAYTPERTVNFEGRAAMRAEEAMAGRPPLSGPLALEVVMAFPVTTSKPKKWQAAALAGEILPTVKPDWDNGGKLTDALNLLVWEDDKQVVEAHVLKYYSEKPGMRMRVYSLTDEADVAQLRTIYPEPKRSAFDAPRVEIAVQHEPTEDIFQ